MSRHVSPDVWPAFIDGVQRLEEELERRGLVDRKDEVGS